MFKFLGILTSFCVITVHAVDWQGHRGARGLYPENTTGAMEVALKYPVTTLEMDVVISKDKKVVLSHEPWMDEKICLDPKGNEVRFLEHNLYKMNYDEILKYDCGSLPHPFFPEQKKVTVGKPLLETVIHTSEALLKKHNRRTVKYSIEIKSSVESEKKGFQPDYRVFTDLVLEVINKKLKNERFFIQSFDWRVLKYINEKYPKTQTVALRDGVISPEEVVKALGFRPTVFSPYFKNLKASDVKAFHKNKIKVAPWTVNEVKDMEVMLKMGVDSIITDYPNRISLVGNEKCSSRENYFEGKCIRIPPHAVASDSNPGWTCKSGYVQKRSRCIKIRIPSNARLMENGRAWECKPGFERYRGTCKRAPR